MMDEERTQRVRDRAHALWEQAGRPHGQDAEHWSQAEREIAAEEDAPSTAPARTAAGRGGRNPKTAVAETTDALKAEKGRSKAAGLVSAEASGTARGRKPKAVADEGAEAPKAARGRRAKSASDEAVNSAETTGRKSQAAATGEDEAPKAKRGRKPKVAAEGSATTE